MSSLLAEYLKRKKISQSEFARLAGIPGPQICQWTNGPRTPSLVNALKIEQATRGAIPASYWTTLSRIPRGSRHSAKARPAAKSKSA